MSATVDTAQECYLLELYREELDDMARRGGGSFTLEIHVSPRGEVRLGDITRKNRAKPWRAAGEKP